MKIFNSLKSLGQAQSKKLTVQQIMAYLASWFSELALIVDSQDKIYCGGKGLRIDMSPAANVLQKHDKLVGEGMSIFLNYEPTMVDIGMMWRAKITNIYYIKERTHKVEVGALQVTANGVKKLEASYVVEKLKSEEIKAFERKNLAIKSAIDTRVFSRPIPQTISEQLLRGLSKVFDKSDLRDETKIEEDFIRLVLNMVSRSWNNGKDNKPKERVYGNNIAAIMVDKNNKLIGWGLNYKSENKYFHAETMMILNYLNTNGVRQLPKGAKIYSSLQCCPMCAAYIAQVGKDVKVIYAMEDPYFDDKTPLHRDNKVNGCYETVTTLPIHSVLKNLINDGNEKILDFLNNKMIKTLMKRPALMKKLSKELKSVYEKKQKRKLDKNESVKNSLSDEEIDILENNDVTMALGKRFLSKIEDIAPASPKSHNVYIDTLRVYPNTDIFTDTQDKKLNLKRLDFQNRDIHTNNDFFKKHEDEWLNDKMGMNKEEFMGLNRNN
jgi:tRNA(Arg) A34 adenosine deaminase TadA